MERTSGQSDGKKVWDLIKDARTALLVTVGENDALEARPMGCLQTVFDGTLWFLTFRHSSKLHQIGDDDRVLVAYLNPEKYEYVAISGRARVVDNRQKLEELWTEGLRVWFPKGPGDPELALLAIDVEKADYWADPASAITYALAYVKARLIGESPSPGKIAENKSVRFRSAQLAGHQSGRVGKGDVTAVQCSQSLPYAVPTRSCAIRERRVGTAHDRFLRW